MSAARILPFDEFAIAEAARLIAEGKPVAVPTETVYGLAADATRGDAVAAIYAAKGRPSFNPLIVHVPDRATTERLADLPAPARHLADAFWPGPLTLVAPLKPGAPIATLATAGLPTVALRVPAHPAMQALLAAAGVPLAAPSANASGTISPTRAAHVAASVGLAIPLIIDAGPTAVGLESTIVAVDQAGLRILRPGPITAEQLAEVAGLPIATVPSDRIEAPGQLLQHYAPSKPIRLNVQAPRHGEWLIGFGAIAGHASLSPLGDLGEAAARLFDLLHQADASTVHAIAVAPIPNVGLGVAINDRLARAAA
ncbi:L-threonylcarbamoyladenylate synthase [Sphingomonas sp.]|uniref:L-threonylcarbamoyladenylate synthase n=1 Tax=Sphingomonas sp. TaxID=28214 RepID=UPI003B3B427C